MPWGLVPAHRCTDGADAARCWQFPAKARSSQQNAVIPTIRSATAVCFRELISPPGGSVPARREGLACALTAPDDIDDATGLSGSFDLPRRRETSVMTSFPTPHPARLRVHASREKNHFSHRGL